jgi:hypothetical protein
MFLSSVLVFNAPSSRHIIPFVMNDSHDVLSSRGVPDAEASANPEGMAVNPSTVRADREPARADHIQVPRSPQLLSLRVDGLNAGIQDKNNHSAAYVESSERGSDTSADGQRPEPHSASTFTDSIPSLPASLSNDYDHTAADSSHSFVENSQSSRTEPGSQNSQDSLHTLSVNGNGVDILHPLKSEHSSNGSLSPARSPRYNTSRSNIDTQLAPRHKRTATGDIKPISAQLITPHSYDVNGASRRRSKSTGSPAHGSRIAQVYSVLKHARKCCFNASIVVCSYSDTIVLCGSQDRKVPAVTNQFSARITWARKPIFFGLTNYKRFCISIQLTPDI